MTRRSRRRYTLSTHTLSTPHVHPKYTAPQAQKMMEAQDKEKQEKRKLFAERRVAAKKRLVEHKMRIALHYATRPIQTKSQHLAAKEAKEVVQVQEPIQPAQPQTRKSVQLLTKHLNVTEVAGMIRSKCRSRRTNANLPPVDTRSLQIADEDWDKACTCTLSTPYVHLMYTLCTPHVHPMYTPCTHSGARFA